MANPTYGQFLQGAFTAPATATTQLVKLPNPTTPGSLLVAFASWGVAASTVVSVTDNTGYYGNKWNLIPPMGTAFSSAIQFFFVPQNLSANAAEVVTVTLSASSTAFSLFIAEYFGGGIYLNTVFGTATSTGPTATTPTTPNTTVLPFMKWDYGSAVQVPGVLVVTGVRGGLFTGTVASTTQRLIDAGPQTALGDSNGLLSPALAAATSFGWTVSGSTGWMQNSISFLVPSQGGIPS